MRDCLLILWYQGDWSQAPFLEQLPRVDTVFRLPYNCVDLDISLQACPESWQHAEDWILVDFREWLSHTDRAVCVVAQIDAEHALESVGGCGIEHYHDGRSVVLSDFCQLDQGDIASSDRNM